MTRWHLPRGSARIERACIAAILFTSASLPLAAAPPVLAENSTAHANNSPVLERIRQTGVIRAAYRENAVPFSFVVDGKPMGYAIDLCLRAVDGLRTALRLPNLRIAWSQVTTATRVETIVEGRADIECGTTGNIRELRERVAFTVPHFFTGTRMLVKSGAGINRWEDLNGKAVAVARGSTTLESIQRLPQTHGINMKIVEADEVNDAFARVESGSVDAMAAGNVLLYGALSRTKKPADYKVVGGFLAVQAFAIMLPKGDTEYKKLVDKAMIDAMYDGETQKLYRKWFLSPIPPNGVTLGVPMSYLLLESFKFPTDKVVN